MCLAIPAKVIKIENEVAEVDIMGASRTASIELVKDIKVGDYVLIHAGCVITKINEDEAKETLELLK
jgi:hydrogenase expression/formation protein HypC